MGKKFHPRPPAALCLHDSIVFAGLVWLIFISSFEICASILCGISTSIWLLKCDSVD